MKTTKKLMTLTLGTLLMASTFMYANINDPVHKKNQKESIEKDSREEATIVGVAAANQNFTTLVTAIKAADLVETLNSVGPFTVFAPTNEAFAKLPEGTVESLLETENKGTLTAVLTYHVVKGKFLASDVLKAIEDNGGKFVIETVNGQKLKAWVKDGNVMLKDAQGNSSKIILTDVAASNGVIHAIDSVVMP